MTTKAMQHSEKTIMRAGTIYSVLEIIHAFEDVSERQTPIESGDDPVMIATPADQFVDDANAFHKAIHAAIRPAAKNEITILGITPDQPETGYGCIQTIGQDTRQAMAVKRFIEPGRRKRHK